MFADKQLRKQALEKYSKCKWGSSITGTALLTLSASFFLLLPTPVWASNYFFCTKDSSYVYLGDSLQKVTQSCGEPSDRSTSKRHSTSQIERWIYSKTIHPKKSNEQIKSSEHAINITFMVDFKKATVKDIVVGHHKLLSSDLCQKLSPIHVGDSQYQVRSICGEPLHKQILHIKNPGPKETITTFRYDSISGPTTMKFHNDKLVKIDS